MRLSDHLGGSYFRQLFPAISGNTQKCSNTHQHTMTIGTRINPKTGMKETYELPPPVDLERSRKELRDMLHGNTQWHVDPNAAPAPEPAPTTKPVIADDQDPDWESIYGYIP